MSPPNQTFGQALPDQVERIVDFLDANLEVVTDVRDLLTARVALEREYANKLQILARKASEKKAKMHYTFVVGKEPTKALDGNTLSVQTLNVAYDSIINSISTIAQLHVTNADAVTAEVINSLQIVEKKSEETKKKEVQYFQKLLSDRERVFSERLKSKQKYDDDCAEVESIRQKQASIYLTSGRATDDRHADRAAKQAEQQKNDMLNSKNSYLISIEIANATKTKFYDEDIPKLQNELQTVQGLLVRRFSRILIHCQELELRNLDAIKTRITEVKGKFSGVDVVQDQNCFINHNIRNFTSPSDWKFEPCSIHYDTDVVSVEAAPKVVIQNKLRRSLEKLQELKPLIHAKRLFGSNLILISHRLAHGVTEKELEKLSTQVSAYKPDHQVGTIDDLLDNYLESAHQSGLYASSERILNVEIDVIRKALGGDEGGSKPHSFKSSAFSIPTQCGYCQSSIWGLSKQGKVPATCEEADERPTSTIFRKTSASQREKPDNTPTITPSASSFVPPSSLEQNSNDDYPSARVLFDFTATSEFELAVREENGLVRVLEHDDGSGWVKVMDEEGDSGLVPASYIAILNDDGKDPAGQNDTSGEHVKAIYPYESMGPDELSLRAGEILELTSGPTGGKNFGDGWWEGFNSQGMKGIFPSNYVGRVSKVQSVLTSLSFFQVKSI
ncbi:hypothetical protein CVT24_011046 [Panaeolus cyanescens]|uniref:SH3 domain-containing protein n=1 Tax=Panaeolus cyanescens TaxID=181874 RepID=A0A409VFY2_9AGAR|nr:hypothetical protein CVT24_011046 [Panaeolus cyanescens]